ncbi:hypothetical protein L7F22_000159 [Adiantum nelumboides]|nr:hypothetical protein [Adiantum nelumboides]
MALLKISSVVPTRWHQASPCFPKSGRRRAVVATIEICKPDDFEVGRLLGTFGYMNVTSYIPPPQMGITEPLGLDQWDVERRMSGQEVGQGGVQVRLYTGRFSRGPRRGTRVVLKAKLRNSRFYVSVSSRIDARCIGNRAPLLDNSSGGVLGSKQVKNQKFQRAVIALFELESEGEKSYESFLGYGMDGNKEESSSSEDRQPILIAHEIGESSVEDTFPLVLQHMDVSARISKWLVRLQEFEYTVQVESSTQASLAGMLTHRCYERKVKVKAPGPEPVEVQAKLSGAHSLYFDGAYKRKVDKASVGISIQDENGQKVFGKELLVENTHSNNEAEYVALALGLEWCVSMGIKRLNVFGDALLLIKQVHGTWACRNQSLVPRLRRVKELMKRFEAIQLYHVPRKGNQEADVLASEQLQEVIVGAIKLQNPLFQGSDCMHDIAYPGRNAGSAEADAMAANELATHAVLQEASDVEDCPNVTRLLGGFQTQTGEQWLVFRDDGQATAADYAKAAGQATTERRAVGDWEFLDYLDYNRPIKRRYIFIIKLLRGAFSGLAHMHSNGRLHQSLGPSSVVIK